MWHFLWQVFWKMSHDIRRTSTLTLDGVRCKEASICVTLNVISTREKLATCSVCLEHSFLIDGRDFRKKENTLTRVNFACSAQWGGAEDHPPEERRSSVCTRATPLANPPWLQLTSSGSCTGSRWPSLQTLGQRRVWLTNMRLRRQVRDGGVSQLSADSKE